MSLEDKLYPFLALYERFPDGVKKGLGFGYRQLPESIRLGKRYRHFKELAEAGEGWDRKEIEEYQFAQVRRTLQQAKQYCPFYEKRFADAGFNPERMHSLDDLKQAPFLEKIDLINHREEIAAANIPPLKRLYMTTGGSTGQPVGFYIEKGVGRAKEQAFLETMWKRGGYFEGARLAMIRGHLTSSRSNGKISGYDATRDWLILSSYHLTAERATQYLERLERFKPDLLYGYSSMVLQLAEFLEKSNQAWRLPLRGILCGSEKLSGPQQKIIERVFKTKCFTWYGHTERVVLAAWGRTTPQFYFQPQYGYVEFGPPTEDGLREVIGTSFDNMAMPFVRYRTGDYVRLLGDDAAPREYPWSVATEIAGREQEFLLTQTGRKISLTAVNMHDDIFDHLYAVQFLQDAPGTVHLRYIPGPSFSPTRLERIKSGVGRKLGDDMELILEQVSEVEKTARGKHKWLVSRIKS